MITWARVAALFAGPALDEKRSELKAKMRNNWDHAEGMDDRATRIEGIDRAVDGEEVCKVECKECLAWNWERQTQRCVLAPSVKVG